MFPCALDGREAEPTTPQIDKGKAGVEPEPVLLGPEEMEGAGTLFTGTQSPSICLRALVPRLKISSAA